MATIEHLEPELDYGGEYIEEEYVEEEYVEEEYVEEEYVEEEYVEENAAPAPAATNDFWDSGSGGGGGMAAMVAAAAAKRKQRIDEGGKLQVRDAEPEERVIPQEHKNVFVSVASEAANVGKMLRFGEHTVEAVSKTKQVEDTWSGPGGLRTDNIRSDFMKAIQEAAAMGAVRGLKPVETTNYDVNEYHEEDPELEDIDKIVDEHGRRIDRTEYLIDYQIEEARREKVKDWGNDDEDRPTYGSVDEVVLPAKRVPGFKTNEKRLSRKDAMDAIAAAVAERAWERNFRLGRPKAQLRVTRHCACPYCVNPNPYQTHKYKELHEQGVEEAEGPLVQEVKKEERLQAQKRSAPAPSFKPNVLPSAQAEVKAGDWKKALKERQEKEAAERAAAPPPVEENQQLEGVTEDGFESFPGHDGGPVVLLDETITFSNKKPKEKKDKKKKKKKGKKGKKDDGCILM